MQEKSNFLTALSLSTLIFGAYYFLVLLPQNKALRAQAELEQQMAVEQAANPEVTVSEEIKIITREEALADNSIERIKIDSPSLSGSFRVKGSRFDDVTLKKYKATLDDDSGNVVMLTPETADKAAYVFDNWVKGDGTSGADADWSVVSGEVLSPDSPVELLHSGDGFNVNRVITVDDRYLITLTDTVTNTSGGEINLLRKGASRQHSLPEGLTNFFIIQEGPVAVADGELQKMKYKKLAKERRETHAGDAGWAGLTDIYWLQAVVAPNETQTETHFEYRQINNREVYEAGYKTAPITLTAGNSITSVGHIFAGAKDRLALERYEKEHNIAEFERAVDYGRLRILVRPMMKVLNWLSAKLGNQGLGILALTLLIKIILFPLFNKQYASQAKMKKVQPKLKKIQKLYKDDRMKLQQEMAALYKKEGVNPLAGCLPIIPTIFVFFALYKTVFINIDLRHAPFFGWIKDLSAKDPLSILNGFGILPWGPEPFGLAILAVGPLALVYAISMAGMQTLSPMPGAGAADKDDDEPKSEMANAMAMQMKMFKYMPWVLMFIIGGFPAGLLLYWAWSNILSFCQQYYITRKFDVDTPFDKFFRKILGRPEPDNAG